MTIRNEYTCNLCGRSEFDGLGICGIKEISSDSLMIVPKEQVKTHICKRCIKRIKELTESEEKSE